MGLSSNQARFLSLTARQVDLENRVQQICQRRLRLASELERVATEYNTSIENRKMFVADSKGGNKELNLANLAAVGYSVIYGNSLLSDGGLMPTGTMINFSGGSYNVGDWYNTNYKIATKTLDAATFTAPTGSPSGMTSSAHSAPSSIPSGTVGVTTGSWSAGTDVNNGTTVSRTYTRTNTEIKMMPTTTTTLPKKTEAEAIAAGYTTIHNLSELQNQISTNQFGKFMLMGDINIPTVTSNSVLGEFYGALDGNGYKITIDINQSGGIAFSGLFAGLNGATVKNLNLAGSVKSNNINVGLLAGYAANTTIENVHSSGNVESLSTAGGLVGQLFGSSIMKNCSSDANVLTHGDSYDNSGGLVGSLGTGSSIETSYATGSVKNDINSSVNTHIGGLVGYTNGDILNSYSTGSVTAGLSALGSIGGLCGYVDTDSMIKYSYTTSNVTNLSSINKGGFVGNTLSTIDDTNYYNNSQSYAAGIGTCNADNTKETTGWNTNIWDLSGANPVFQEAFYTSETWTDTYVDTQPVAYSYTAEEYTVDTIDDLEEGIRGGKYTLAKEADEYTQEPIEIDGQKYEKIDWRTATALNDELDKSDDADAESKYDTTVANINSQDKKLQLEQSSVEVEYKAVASEKDAVKKILDTNATSSFKYFG